MSLCGSRKLRVLVADDDRDLALTLMMLLKSEGHEVRGVHHGVDVLEAVADFSPDALLLDIGLPLVSGYDIARSLRDRYGSARPMIVAITGRNRPEDKQMAELAGFDHHFAKPFEPRALLATLDSLLR
jgi:DNA-binding response OmpR family regulator